MVMLVRTYNKQGKSLGHFVGESTGPPPLRHYPVKDCVLKWEASFYSVAEYRHERGQA